MFNFGKPQRLISYTKRRVLLFYKQKRRAQRIVLVGLSRIIRGSISSDFEKAVIIITTSATTGGEWHAMTVEKTTTSVPNTIAQKA